MSEQMVAPPAPAGDVTALRGEAARRMLAFWRWVQMHCLPTPVAVWPESGEVLLPSLRAFEWWLASLGDVSVFVQAVAPRRDDQGVGLMVSAVGEPLSTVGRVKIELVEPAPHLQPFGRRPASLPEVRGLLAPIGSDSGGQLVEPPAVDPADQLAAGPVAAGVV